MRKASAMTVGVGGASILAVFILIVLATFAGLAVSSANADIAFAKRAAKNVVTYYELDELAQQKICNIADCLVQQNIAGVNIPGVLVEGDKIFFDIEAKTQKLSVELQITGSKYTIEKYKITPVISGEYGETDAEIWDGQPIDG